MKHDDVLVGLWEEDLQGMRAYLYDINLAPSSERRRDEMVKQHRIQRC